MCRGESLGLCLRAEGLAAVFRFIVQICASFAICAQRRKQKPVGALRQLAGHGPALHDGAVAWVAADEVRRDAEAFLVGRGDCFLEVRYGAGA